ncbi:DUF721 domain-containing protein [bacterium]|jgi:hypothetical protein|nr:DUF721 domain-containing protein [bacterium]MBT3903572.1 DUF721 domain-containing protein [bacterium]MBT4577920.1 DUF721 domain-containing protein [bacterium]MBT5345715.1 DUF721 domain-containing protein [bacterium]MBT6130797.1 DUF721 domain-containing protein [bacterium]
MASSVKTFIDGYFKKHSDWRWSLLENWKQIMGQMHEHVFLEKVYKETVVIGVYHSSWMHELYLLSPVLLKKINSVFETPRIKRVRFKLKGQKLYGQAKRAKYKQLQAKPVQLSSPQLKALEKLDDDDLQRHLKGFFKQCQTGAAKDE